MLLNKNYLLNETDLLLLLCLKECLLANICQYLKLTLKMSDKIFFCLTKIKKKKNLKSLHRVFAIKKITSKNLY